MMTSAVALLRGAQLQTSLSRHLLFGQRALQDAICRRGNFQRFPLVEATWAN